jgi:hypothetical protein
LHLNCEERNKLGIGTHSAVEVEHQKFHVETEARGGERPVIDTTVYSSGRVIYRRVKSYDDLLALPGANDEALQERVDSQHRDVIGDLRSGALKFGETGPAPKLLVPPAPIEFPKGIEVRLLNAGSWLASGTASLNIEVRGRATHKPASGVTVEIVMEGARPEFHLQAGTDPRGRVSLVFPMPKLSAEGGELVIRAGGAAGRDELRYKLKPKVVVAKKAQMP